MAESVLTKGQPLYRLPTGGTPNAPGRKGTAAPSAQPLDRSANLAQDEARLRGELGRFQSRVRGLHDGPEEKFWQKEVAFSPEIHASPEFQAVVAEPKPQGLIPSIPSSRTPISKAAGILSPMAVPPYSSLTLPAERPSPR